MKNSPHLRTARVVLALLLAGVLLVLAPATSEAQPFDKYEPAPLIDPGYDFGRLAGNSAIDLEIHSVYATNRDIQAKFTATNTGDRTLHDVLLTYSGLRNSAECDREPHWRLGGFTLKPGQSVTCNQSVEYAADGQATTFGATVRATTPAGTWVSDAKSYTHFRLDIPVPTYRPRFRPIFPGL